MPRQPRIDLPGIPQHVVQQGNDRRPCFFQSLDHVRYRPMTCDEIFGSCAAGATGAARNMCFVRRNQCRAALED